MLRTVLAAVVLAVVVVGYAIAHWSRIGSARALAWATLVLGTLGVDWLLAREPAGVRMVALITFALLVMKVIVVIEERARGMRPLCFRAWLGFAGGWLGMNPRLFASADSGSLPGAGALIRRAGLHAVLGTLLVLLASLIANSRWLATLLLLPGLSLLLHFGFCNVLAGGWRLKGVACDALVRAPLKSQTLGEFWARRWNLAFTEMTAIAGVRLVWPLA